MCMHYLYTCMNADFDFPYYNYVLNRIMLRVFVLVVVVLGCLLTSSVYAGLRCTMSNLHSLQTPTVLVSRVILSITMPRTLHHCLVARKSNVTLLFVEGVHLLTEPKFE